jgi:hypothetical protein
MQGESKSRHFGVMKRSSLFAMTYPLWWREKIWDPGLRHSGLRRLIY